MITDLFDTIDLMLWAMAFWIVVGAVLVAAVALVAGWGVAKAVRQARRALSARLRAEAGDTVPHMVEMGSRRD